MRPYSEEALELKLSLEAGLVGIADVIEWTDRVFMACEDYDDDLANVCLAKDASVKEMISLLGKLIDHREEWTAVRRTMARMYDALRQNPERIHEFTRFLEHFWVRHDYDVPDDMSFIAGVDDELQLAQQGTYGTVEQARECLLDNLSRYKDNTEQGTTTNADKPGR